MQKKKGEEIKLGFSTYHSYLNCLFGKNVFGTVFFFFFWNILLRKFFRNKFPKGFGKVALQNHGTLMLARITWKKLLYKVLLDLTCLSSREQLVINKQKKKFISRYQITNLQKIWFLFLNSSKKSDKRIKANLYLQTMSDYYL